VYPGFNYAYNIWGVLTHPVHTEEERIPLSNPHFPGQF